jgi:hypothetical protein
MGKLARIQELEAQLEFWKKASGVHDDLTHYLRLLAELPEDAVLLYTLTGQKMSHEIGKSARVLLAKVYGEEDLKTRSAQSATCRTTNSSP